MNTYVTPRPLGDSLPPQVGSSSPWGAVQHRQELAPGLWWVSTAGHGGAWVSPERLAELPEVVRRANIYSGAGSPWFEEDAEWALVALVFPEAFAKGTTSPEKVIEVARRSLTICGGTEVYGEALAALDARVGA